jgi:GNAT superfamily N-acetyltransferase
VIRRATADDAERVAAIFEPSFALLDFLPQLHTHEKNVAFFRRMLGEGEGWLHDRGGFALLVGDTLWHLYVHPDALGTGVGHELFEHVIAQRPRGFDFWVFQANDRARRFYEAHGAVAAVFTDGSGNVERTPDVRYEWRP